MRKNLDDEKLEVKDQLKLSRWRTKEMRNRERWLDSISQFQTNLEDMETKSDEDKKRFLEFFVERIDVGFDHNTKEHELTIKFKLPLVGDKHDSDGDVLEGRFKQEVTLPPNNTTLQSRFSPGSGAGPRPCL